MKPSQVVPIGLANTAPATAESAPPGQCEVAGRARGLPAPVHSEEMVAVESAVTHVIGSRRRLRDWSGMALIAGGALLPLATLLHPSLETVDTIIASEVRLVAAHALFTASWVLFMFGLPGLYAAGRARLGRVGLAGFLGAFTSTYLLAVSGNFGFLAPVLARKAPAAIDAISQYPPVVILNALAAIGFMLGYILFGIAMTRRTPTRVSGVLVAVGAPSHLLGFGMAQLLSPAIWPLAVLGAASLGAGLAWPGRQLWRGSAAAERPPLNPRKPA